MTVIRRITDTPTTTVPAGSKGGVSKGGGTASVDSSSVTGELDALRGGRSRQDHSRDIFRCREIRGALIELLCETFGDNPDASLESLRHLVKRG